MLFSIIWKIKNIFSEQIKYFEILKAIPNTIIIFSKISKTDRVPSTEAFIYKKMCEKKMIGYTY